MTIDWTGAPEGTTHVDPEDESSSKWIRYEEGVWYYWSDILGEEGDWCQPFSSWVIPSEDKLIPRPTENSKENQEKTLVEVWYATDARNCLEVNGVPRMFYPGAKVEIYVTPPEETQAQKDSREIREIIKLHPKYPAEDIEEMLRLKFDLTRKGEHK